MTIRYLNHSINECQHIETGETWYELSHWFTSDKSPDYAGRVSNGFFQTYQEAEEKHNAMLVDGLLKDENARDN